jgi:hypothetical protein
VHFELLARDEGGLLHLTSSLDEHVADLSRLVTRDPYAVDERSRDFVRSFVRPNGLDVSPTQVFTRELLALLRSKGSAGRVHSLQRAAGALAARCALALGAPLEERPVGSLASGVRKGARPQVRRVGHGISRRLRKRIRVASAEPRDG